MADSRTPIHFENAIRQLGAAALVAHGSLMMFFIISGFVLRLSLEHGPRPSIQRDRHQVSARPRFPHVSDCGVRSHCCLAHRGTFGFRTHANGSPTHSCLMSPPTRHLVGTASRTVDGSGDCGVVLSGTEPRTSRAHSHAAGYIRVGVQTDLGQVASALNEFFAFVLGMLLPTVGPTSLRECRGVPPGCASRLRFSPLSCRTHALDATPEVQHGY